MIKIFPGHSHFQRFQRFQRECFQVSGNRGSGGGRCFDYPGAKLVAIWGGCKSFLVLFKRMDKVGLIDEYINPCYEALHTESRKNITKDVIETLYSWEAESVS